MSRRNLLPLSLSLLLCLVAPHLTPASDEESRTELGVGDTAPVFTAIDDAGKPWSSASVVGKKLLAVYFYPAAMTGGCTKQACAYRDSRDVLQDLGIEVVGVSGDSPKGLRLFKQDSNLNFTLLSDPNGSIAAAFGVPTRDGGQITRTVDGEEHTLIRTVTASRWTFLIDRDGKIIYKDAAVKAASDASRIIDVARGLQAGE